MGVVDHGGPGVHEPHAAVSLSERLMDSRTIVEGLVNVEFYEGLLSVMSGFPFVEFLAWARQVVETERA